MLGVGEPDRFPFSQLAASFFSVNASLAIGDQRRDFS